MIVFRRANGTFSFAVSDAHNSGRAARKVKYIANRAAKNITSLESQTMVPTETRFGRLGTGWAGAFRA